MLNPNNEVNKCFQYSTILSLHNKQVGQNVCRISAIKPFINNLGWENINFPPQKQDYQQLEMHNKSIALNILQVDNNNKSLNLIKQEKVK